MAEVPRERRRKRDVHLYLREEIIQSLERVAADSELSVSQVAEILLGFSWELNGLCEKLNFLEDLNRRFRRTT